MNVVFLGGGSLRLTPIIRGLLKREGIFNGGSIRLVDRMLDRAELVGRAVMRCPEMKGVDCRVSWTDDLDSALEGADMLYITMAIEREPSGYLSSEASVRYGFLCSDQLSVNGAFLAARGGSPILSFARKMEKYCPKAMMLIFANPVAVYSAMVNNHTKIRALGICGGYRNHCWDLPRICGRDEYDDSMELVSAGVNHLSFILRGDWHGLGVFDVLREHLTPTWQPPAITTNSRVEAVQLGLRQMADLFHRYGTTIFSTEGDGIGHLFPEGYLKDQKEHFKPLTAEQLKQHVANANSSIDARFAKFASELNRNDDSIWNAPHLKNPLFGLDTSDLSISVMAALAGLGSFRIAASAPNRGAVAGFSERMALEYTMTIDGKNLTPEKNLYVPAPFYSFIAGLSEFQTLQADAIATGDPRIFADALEAYPVNRFSSSRKEYFREMFDIYTDIPKSLQDGKSFVGG
jgi:alpha-galactosidase/6-phospho-beta-glucosidase family protein